MWLGKTMAITKVQVELDSPAAPVNFQIVVGQPGEPEDHGVTTNRCHIEGNSFFVSSGMKVQGDL
jgi:hypothetical protein